MMASKNNNKKSQSTPRTNNKTRNKEPGAKSPAGPTNRSQGLTIVGIGASAGGLRALSSFFEALASNTGMAFKEEFQSVNEELQTVNNDMNSKLEELSHAHQEPENPMGCNLRVLSQPRKGTQVTIEIQPDRGHA